MVSETGMIVFGISFQILIIFSLVEYFPYFVLLNVLWSCYDPLVL